MMKKRLLSAVALAALTVPSYAMAEDAVDPNTGALSFGLDLNYTTSYFFRGYNQEDIGLILQPNLFVGFNVVSSDDLTVDLKVGTWNSFHEEQTGGDNMWFESDLYALATVGLMQKFYFNVGYTAYFYPNDAFDTIQELGISASFSDAAMWKEAGVENFALNPEIGIYKETSDGNGTQDAYAEIKLTPSVTLDLQDVPYLGNASLSFPIKLGLSLDDYYLDSDGDNETFGYGSIGVATSIPLAMPAKYGAWSINAGVEYIHLFADSAELSNDGGTDYELIGTLGLSIRY
jgi:hypothetical protein